VRNGDDISIYTYSQFRERYCEILSELGETNSEGQAKEIWDRTLATLERVGPDVSKVSRDESGRIRLGHQAFQRLMSEFNPIIARMEPAMDHLSESKIIWAFWSGGKAASTVAEKNAEIKLETSALGKQFDNLAQSFYGWQDVALWASLSRAYARFASRKMGERKYRGFLGPDSDREQTILKKIEMPTFWQAWKETARHGPTKRPDLTFFAVALRDLNEPDMQKRIGDVEGVCASSRHMNPMIDAAVRERKRITGESSR